jgi:hypothetical protein
MDNFAEYDRAYRSLFKPPFPARCTVGAQVGDITVEIEVIASGVPKDRAISERRIGGAIAALQGKARLKPGERAHTRT